MRVLQKEGNIVQHDYLRALYGLAGGVAKTPVYYGDVSLELGCTEEEAGKACDFWTDRGVVEWATLGHVALTYLGLRKAERLANSGWSPTPF